jgi:hypothetical protein
VPTESEGGFRMFVAGRMVLRLFVESHGTLEEEEVLFIGTQFSNLSTAVDTSAAAACNAWCVFFFF